MNFSTVNKASTLNGLKAHAHKARGLQARELKTQT